MSITKKYVGLDVSKSKIAMAIADEGREEARSWGMVPHTKEAVSKLMKQIGQSVEGVTLEVCYEAGPTGYVLYRWLLEMNIACTIIAPSLIPKREVMDMARFPTAGAFMSYCGLVPGESSTGDSRRQGKITKAGNAHLRRVLVEAAWSYRYTPSIKRKMRERIEGLPPSVQAIAWSAQHRLHKVYRTMRGWQKEQGEEESASSVCGQSASAFDACI